MTNVVTAPVSRHQGRSFETEYWSRDYFDSLGNLITIILEIQYHTKYNDGKFMIYFSNTNYDVLVTSQNLKLKHNMYTKKQKRKILLRSKLHQLK